MEFASELHDFLRKDVHRWYPDLEDKVGNEGGRGEGKIGGERVLGREGGSRSRKATVRARSALLVLRKYVSRLCSPTSCSERVSFIHPRLARPFPSPFFSRFL